MNENEIHVPDLRELPEQDKKILIEELRIEAGRDRARPDQLKVQEQI